MPWLKKERLEDIMFKKYEQLKFTDNFMFCHILQNNPELCKDIVEAILDVKIREIVRIGKEESVKPSSDGHGVRLDVYLEGDDAIYDIEMQTSDTGNLRKRSRYYQGVLDTDFLKTGHDYNELRKSYVIFICSFDLFGEKKPRYTFRNVCDEVPELELDDEAVKVFVNAKGALDESSPLLEELLKYITDGTVSGALTERIETDVKEALKNEETRSKYMTFEWELATKYREGMEAGIEKGMEAGIEKGIEQGIEKGRLDAIRKMLSKLSQEDILSMGYGKDEIERACNMPKDISE